MTIQLIAISVAGFYLAAALAYLLHFVRRATAAATVGSWLLRVGLGVHTGWLVGEHVALGYLPFARVAEAMSFVAWSLVAVYVLIEARIRDHSLGTFLIPVGLLFQVCSVLIVWGAEEPGPLKEMLKTFWFEAHVTTALFSYSAFSISFAAGIMYVLLCHELKLHKLGVFFSRLPPLGLLERINYHAMALGFLFLTVGILTGMIWMHRSYGTFLWRDSKEISAVTIWLLYAANLHTRYLLGWRGQRTAVFSVVNFLILLSAFYITSVVQGAHQF